MKLEITGEFEVCRKDSFSALKGCVALQFIGRWALSVTRSAFPSLIAI
ncbi:MAG: hypothetical protein ACTHLX_06885 [Candidatus Binatia bacterium]